MTKLEEIKNRANTTALNQATWAEHYRGDVQFLLAKIGELKKANPVDDDGYIICPNCGRIKLDQ